jgi:hypothetical protein
VPDISTGLDHTRQILSARIPTPKKPYVEVYAILLKPLTVEGDAKAKMIGTVGAPRNEPAGAEIGYGLHPHYWGKGYMSEAVKLFIGLYWSPGSSSSPFMHMRYPAIEVLGLLMAMKIFSLKHTDSHLRRIFERYAYC